jgi:hypothetical protein
MTVLPSWTEVLKSLVFWGPGALIAALMIWVTFKLLLHMGTKVADLGGEFIKSQQAMAEASGRQAQSMEGLRDSIQASVGRDNSDHKDMLVLLQYIANHQETFMKTSREHESCIYCRSNP